VRKDGRGVPGDPGGGREFVDVRGSRRSGTDEQRGGAGGATCGVLAEDELRHGQRAGQSVRGADAHGGGIVPATRTERPRLPRAGRHRTKAITAATGGVNGYLRLIHYYTIAQSKKLTVTVAP
jgi:hypothetical protein